MNAYDKNRNRHENILIFFNQAYKSYAKTFFMLTKLLSLNTYYELSILLNAHIL